MSRHKTMSVGRRTRMAARKENGGIRFATAFGMYLRGLRLEQADPAKHDPNTVRNRRRRGKTTKVEEASK